MEVKNQKLKIKSECKLFLICLLFPLALLSQQKNFPLNREFSLIAEKSLSSGIADERMPVFYEHPTTKQLVEIGKSGHTGFKPHIILFSPYRQDKTYSMLARKIKKESLFIAVDTADKFYLTIDPLFDFEYGQDQKDSSKSFHKNTRGILIRGHIGKRFSFESSFHENQATFVKYISDFNESFLVIPGQGRWKRFKANGYDYAMASGYISYSPGKHFNFQAGHGKHFVGDGYRSLLLSDNAFNYPFARITSTFGKVQYTNLYTTFMNLTFGGVKTPPGTEPLFQKKAGNFQFLSWNVSRRIQWGFFQGLIWKAADSENQQHLKLAYASPLIYTAALSEGFAGENNVLLGSTLKFKITNSISLYSQLMFDDISGSSKSIYNKTGYQGGFKYYDALGAKNLHLQIEYNQARPYSYAHSNVRQNYSHYNQSLSHPLGANFKETIAILNYRLGDFFTELKFNYALIGKDSIGRNYGNNIFSSDSTAYFGTASISNDLGQGINTTLRIIDFHIGYLVNPATNFNIIIGLSNRSSINSLQNSQTNFLYFGIRTSLSNVYYDF